MCLNAAKQLAVRACAVVLLARCEFLVDMLVVSVGAPIRVATRAPGRGFLASRLSHCDFHFRCFHHQRGPVVRPVCHFQLNCL